ncbi:MAG: Maf family protein [Planctomycetota bacterium]|nr:Maf family protein [Planctomycetota bacterium]
MIAPLVLASSSPRRRAALEEVGVPFEVLPAEHDGPALGEDPATRVLSHARFKAREVAAQRPDAFVLAGDTLVVRDAAFLPKPLNRADAERMLHSLSGRAHEVWTGTLLLAPDGREYARGERARVRFDALPEIELQAYLDGSEWKDKAGAYGIQGWAGRWARLESGRMGTVIGFDPELIRLLLAEAAAAR